MQRILAGVAERRDGSRTSGGRGSARQPESVVPCQQECVERSRRVRAYGDCCNGSVGRDATVAVIVSSATTGEERPLPEAAATGGCRDHCSATATVANAASTWQPTRWSALQLRCSTRPCIPRDRRPRGKPFARSSRPAPADSERSAHRRQLPRSGFVQHGSSDLRINNSAHPGRVSAPSPSTYLIRNRARKCVTPRQAVLDRTSDERRRTDGSSTPDVRDRRPANEGVICNDPEDFESPRVSTISSTVTLRFRRPP